MILNIEQAETPQGLKQYLEPVIGQVETPGFIIDERALQSVLRIVDRVKAETGCHVLYALKPFPSADVMDVMTGHVNGFAASSLYEATLARNIVGKEGTVHITTPGFRPDEMATLGDLCDYVALNSLSQWERYRKTLSGKTSVGLRINPQLSFADDERYDPCREASKLGMPINLLTDVLAKNPSRLDGLKGIHFHTNCDSATFQPLLETVRLVTQELDPLLKRMEWVNIGGGYLFESESELPYLYEAIALLKSRYNVEVFMEPGAALVRDAGLLVASVIDLFESDDTQIALLDTSVNHLPEVYEYQYEPDILGDSEEGEYEYLLSGATCLAGDVFGEYGFDEPLEIGSRIVIPKMGAYTLVKAHMFNGVNLPTIYFLTESGELKLRQRFTYQDFLSRLGGHADAGL